MNQKDGPAQAKNEAKPNLAPCGRMIQLQRTDVEEKIPMTGDRGFVTSADRIGLIGQTLPVRISFLDRDGVMRPYQVWQAIGVAGTGEIIGFRYRPAFGDLKKGWPLEIFTYSKHITL